MLAVVDTMNADTKVEGEAEEGTAQARSAPCSPANHLVSNRSSPLASRHFQQAPSTVSMTATASLSHLQWRATEWILAFGPLNRQIVLDYFVLSPFFDRTSTNAALRMQMQFSRGGMEGVDEEGELT